MAYRFALSLLVAVVFTSAPPVRAAPGGADAALAALEDRVEAAPADPLAHNELGVALVGHGDLDRAEVHLWLAVLLDDGLATGWSNLGLLFRKAKRHDAALAAFGRSLTMDPAQPSIWYGAAGSLRATKRSAESMFALQAFLQHAAADHPKRGKVDRVLSSWADKGIAPAEPSWPAPAPPKPLVKRATEAVAAATKVKPAAKPPETAKAEPRPAKTATPKPKPAKTPKTAKPKPAKPAKTVKPVKTAKPKPKPKPAKTAKTAKTAKPAKAATSKPKPAKTAKAEPAKPAKTTGRASATEAADSTASPSPASKGEAPTTPPKAEPVHPPVTDPTVDVPLDLE
ncbi:MAG: hypothetical protein QF464_17610, partial [Myxococcota bacterium]|nr:hypothetical protein [Myxococcota bacterium]